MNAIQIVGVFLFLSLQLVDGRSVHADQTTVDALRALGATVRTSGQPGARSPILNSIKIPHEFEWNDNAQELILEALSVLQPDPTLILQGPVKVSDHQLSQLTGAYPKLIVAQRATVFLGAVFRDDGLCTVTRVLPESPADLASMGKGDVILSVDGHQTTTFKELQRALIPYLPGEVVTLKLKRGDQVLVKRAILQDDAILRRLLDRAEGEPSDAPESSNTPAPLEADPLGPGDR